MTALNKENKNNNDRTDHRAASVQKQRAKPHRTKSVATYRVLEATAIAPEGAREPPRTPTQTVAPRTQNIPSTESPDRTTTETADGTHISHRPSAHMVSGHHSPTKPMQSTPSPSFEKEGECRGLGHQEGNPATVSSAPVDKAQADRLQDTKRRRSTTVTARGVSSHAAAQRCSTIFFFLSRFTLLRKVPRRVNGRNTITPDPADLRPILRFS